MGWFPGCGRASKMMTDGDREPGGQTERQRSPKAEVPLSGIAGLDHQRFSCRQPALTIRRTDVDYTSRTNCCQSRYMMCYYNYMNNDIYDDIAIEGMMKDSFGVEAEIEKVYARSIPAGRTVQATVFLTTKNKLYALVSGSAPLTLGDVRKILIRMGLRAESYVPPIGQPHYFNDMAVERFKSVYPGRHDITDADLRFYRLATMYNPALVVISEITMNIINQFDPSADTGWRPAVKAHYKRIKTN